MSKLIKELEKELKQAKKEALEESAKKIEASSLDLISKQRNLPSNVLKKQVEVKVVEDGNEVIVSDEPFSMIDFVLGDKSPRRQKGIKVKDRVPIEAEVVPGKRIKLRRSFIARGRKEEVFNRKGKKRFPIARQSVPSSAQVIQQQTNLNKIEDTSEDVFEREFENALGDQLNLKFKEEID